WVRLEVRRYRLLLVRRGGTVGEKAFPAQLVGGALHARDVLVARELFVLLQQPLTAPRLRRRLALVPHAVAVHVDEHLLAVERLEALTGERRERRGARRALGKREIHAERAGDFRKRERRVLDRAVAARAAELRPIRMRRRRRDSPIGPRIDHFGET